MKVLSKKVIVQKKEVAHTIGERNILVRTAMADSPFIVGLKFSFQTPSDLYLVTGFMSGGELFWHLQKEGRFNESRANICTSTILCIETLNRKTYCLMPMDTSLFATLGFQRRISRRMLQPTPFAVRQNI